MDAPSRSPENLLRSLRPVMHDGTYVFVCIPDMGRIAGVTVVATVIEEEGLSAIVSEDEAAAAGLPCMGRWAWITLTAHTDLDAVGLTAAVSGALASAGIACNVVAGAHHDHLFVPYGQAYEAMEALRVLQHDA